MVRRLEWFGAPPDHSLRSEYSVKRISKKIIDQAITVLESEVKIYDQYLTGDTYDFVLYKKDNCDLGHEHLEVIDSCCGFYGSDPTKNGMSDHIENFDKFV